MFEASSRLKLRFDTDKGNLSDEDLWDLSVLPNGPLDNLAKGLNKAIKESGEESFVAKKSNVDDILELKLSIVKRVIEVKLAEIKGKKQLKLNKEKKEILVGLLVKKQNEKIEKYSETKLMKMIEEL